METWKWGNVKLSGFQNEFQEGYIEVTPDAGSPFKRVRFSDIQDIQKGTFTIDKVQYIDFMSWYKYNIRQGAIPFEYFDCRISRKRTARIIGKPTFTSNSRFFDVNITLTFDSEVFFLDRIIVTNETRELEANNSLLTVDVRRAL